MRTSTAYYLLALSISFEITGFSQQEYYPFETSHYGFIDYSKNRFTLFKDSSFYLTLYNKFDSLLQYGTGGLSVVHIGGSHIQADIYTHRIRQRFNMFEPGIMGARGFIFPYLMAQTNNPSNFGVKYTGNWTYCKNIYSNVDCELGLAGYSVTTNDTLASVKVFLNKDSTMHFEFNRLKIFHPYTRRDFNLKIMPSAYCNVQARNEKLGYTEYFFDRFLDSIEFVTYKTDSLQNRFELLGLSFESDDPGIIYNTVGVNGARLSSYLRCELFENHLQALKPDLVVISIGTNDGNTRRFDEELYQSEYIELLSKIRRAAPDAAILLTVPNDSYLFKRYINRNTEKMMHVILTLAKQYNLAVWDFYSIMGGLNSAQAWYDAGLMNRDHIHFNKQGYILKGDLFFAAFLNTWDDFLNNSNSK